MMKRFFIPLILTLPILLNSCGDTQLEKDLKFIEEYIVSHSLDTNDVKVDEYGVHYIELKEGVGRNVEETDSVVFVYSLRLINDVEASFVTWDDPFCSKVSTLVGGLRLGMTNMKAEGKAVILMPSSLGYGPYWYSTIPSNSVLIFYVDLIKVVS
ncbi:FKBP-type peptidyl-prolyl cis-trans isomerase [Bacteroidales bacterium OttesenSCG-928-K22]|nr:FKBP-type peptidyl-prolyl cis-trans isomerase [Bacteroidales bacterium OttesenSCG-928-K22]